MKKINHIEISSRFEKFVESFYNIESTEFDMGNFEISKSIFFHVFKIKSSLWKQSEKFNRRKRISISEIFHDIIAVYLKLALGDKYEIILEEKINRLQPDILIKYNDKNLFVLEIKTTIGWDRTTLKGGIQNRIIQLSETFNIPKDNVVYIFQSPWNVNLEFTERYWDIENRLPKTLPTEFPYNKIRPLLTGDDPFYLKKDKNDKYYEYNDSEIKEFSEKCIVIPLEYTINEILNASKALS